MSWPGFSELLTAGAATGEWVGVSSGYYNWTVEGTFGSTSAQLQWRHNSSGEAIDVTSAVVTAAGGFSGIPLGDGQCRVKLTGGSAIVLNSRLQKVL